MAITKEALELLRLNYFQSDKPCPLTLLDGTTLNLYPILVEDYSLYESVKGIIEIDKNAISDVKIIQMSYLQFLESVIFRDNEDSINNLTTLLYLCTRFEYFRLGEEDNRICLYFLSDGSEEATITHKMKPKEFDDMVKIIIHQNDPNYDDTYYSPEVKQAMDEYYSIKFKSSSNVAPTLEKQKVFVMSKMGITRMSELNQMTYRMFIQTYKSLVDVDIFFARKIIQASQKYEVKEDIPHPLFDKPVDKLSEVFSMTNEQLSDKINGATPQ